MSTSIEGSVTFVHGKLGEEGGWRGSLLPVNIEYCTPAAVTSILRLSDKRTT